MELEINDNSSPNRYLAMIADCSNGMEPAFALAFEKRVTVGRFFYTNKIVEQVLKENNYNDEILAKIADNYGSLKGIEIPQWMQDVFVTAMDIHWSDYRMAREVYGTSRLETQKQSTCQRM